MHVLLVSRVLKWCISSRQRHNDEVITHQVSYSYLKSWFENVEPSSWSMTVYIHKWDRLSVARKMPSRKQLCIVVWRCFCFHICNDSFLHKSSEVHYHRLPIFIHACLCRSDTQSVNNTGNLSPCLISLVWGSNHLWPVILVAAIKICGGFEKLHLVSRGDMREIEFL